MKTKHSQKAPVANPESSLDEATRKHVWERYEASTAKQKQRAQKNLEIVQAYVELEQDGISQKEILLHLAKRFEGGVSKSTCIRRRQSVEGVGQNDWLALMLPSWKGNTSQAEYTEEARQWIRENYLILSKPALRAIYRRAQNLAHRKGWVIPSYDAVKRDSLRDEH